MLMMILMSCWLLLYPCPCIIQMTHELERMALINGENITLMDAVIDLIYCRPVIKLQRQSQGHRSNAKEGHDPRTHVCVRACITCLPVEVHDLIPK